MAHSQDEMELGFHPPWYGSRTYAVNHDSQHALWEVVCQLDELVSLVEALGLVFLHFLFFSQLFQFQFLSRSAPLHLPYPVIPGPFPSPSRFRASPGQMTIGRGEGGKKRSRAF